MDNIHWQLSILSKAVHYKNLSGAASHVGVSQPQLSRIVSRLEEELGVVLLDRAARRKSGWTPIAFKIADTYFRTSRKLTQTLEQLKDDDQPTHLTIGTLEGLMNIASDFCAEALAEPKLKIVELNVYDLSELEEKFVKDELDLVFTSREPGRHKHRHVRDLGYQVFDRHQNAGGPRVLSPYEYANHAQPSKKSPPKGAKSSQPSQLLVSNSLAVRRLWIENHGASGSIPSDMRRRKTSDADTPVILVASDLMNPAVWARLEQIRL
jgi:DNA-binding transcriptional LysR family regulator